MEVKYGQVVHLLVETHHTDFTTWPIYNWFTSVDKFSNWAAKRLGYPIVAVELQRSVLCLLRRSYY